ncbi:MAG: putative integral membrane protein [Mariniflexile sp.]|jgi:uncharacterized integral membrane protein
MKISIIIISILGFGLAIFNFTKVNFNAPFEGESMTALITVLASLCVVLMMLILMVSKNIEQKVKGRR